MPAYIVMTDNSLDALCRVRPATADQLMNVLGFGEKKVEKYGAEILQELKRFEEGERAAASRKWQKLSPAEETLQLLAQGKRLEEIARARGRQLASVVSLVSEMVESGEAEFQPGWIAGERWRDSRGLRATGSARSVAGIEGCAAGGDYV